MSTMLKIICFRLTERRGSNRRLSSHSYRGSTDEDEHEKAQLKKLERKMQKQGEDQEQKDYKEEFFELLDEVSRTWK